MVQQRPEFGLTQFRLECRRRIGRLGCTLFLKSFVGLRLVLVERRMQRKALGRLAAEEINQHTTHDRAQVCAKTSARAIVAIAPHNA